MRFTTPGQAQSPYLQSWEPLRSGYLLLKSHKKGWARTSKNSSCIYDWVYEPLKIFIEFQISKTIDIDDSRPQGAYTRY